MGQCIYESFMTIQASVKLERTFEGRPNLPLGADSGTNLITFKILRAREIQRVLRTFVTFWQKKILLTNLPEISRMCGRRPVSDFGLRNTRIGTGIYHNWQQDDESLVASRPG